MKVFISHSGDRSRELADTMKWFVSNLLQATDPWVSTGIEKGARWEAEIAHNLHAAAIGIVCLTSDNLEKPWILFEAGALAKQLDGNVCTLLLDVEKEQVKLPLGQFQATKAERDDVWKLVKTINTLVDSVKGRSRSDSDLKESFELYWPKLEDTILRLRNRAPAAAPKARAPEEMLAELLDLTREIGRAIGMQEKTLHLVRSIYTAVKRQEPPTLDTLRRYVLIGELERDTQAVAAPMAAGGDTPDASRGKEEGSNETGPPQSSA